MSWKTGTSDLVGNLATSAACSAIRARSKDAHESETFNDAYRDFTSAADERAPYNDWVILNCSSFCGWRLGRYNGIVEVDPTSQNFKNKITQLT